jgi:predicted metalloprotease with PDZ domain
MSKPVFLTLACLVLMALVLACSVRTTSPGSKNDSEPVTYELSLKDGQSHIIHVVMNCQGTNSDTVELRMPAWMPGYYQIMDYSKQVTDLKISDSKGTEIGFSRPDANSWKITSVRGKPFRATYSIKADRRFVACNYIDSAHAYIVPCGTFLYLKDHLDLPAKVRLITDSNWTQCATGLDSVPGTKNEFSATDYNTLFDCPILAGNIESLTPFTIGGVKHRFIAWDPGAFDRKELMSNLEKAVKTATDLIGDIPYREYTFIGIGPGFGGIEHSNNCTVSFKGDGLTTHESMSRVLHFFIHEYFHLFNVKRIRPYELGPFDYSKENHTNLLWVSEGFTVYYEYIVLKRAGLITEQDFYNDLANSLNAYENDPGKSYQSLSEASYDTWSDGPFGKQGSDDRSISYYDKGAVAGFILDLAIRNSSGNKKSLDDVMRLLYNRYYKCAGRGFTDAEFRAACEETSGSSLNDEFEYATTTRVLDYNKCLAIAGLKLGTRMNQRTGKQEKAIVRIENQTAAQSAILESILK